MSDQALMMTGMFLTLLAVLCVLAFWRLRRWSAARSDAEQRAALALEELQRAAAELRSKRVQP